MISIVFYDQAKAFDCVSPEALKPTLERIRLPSRTIGLIISGIVGATSRARTFYGLSSPRILRRGLRQGDPLSTIIYAFFIDPLHARLEELAITKGAGYALKNSLYPPTASSGFVDDIAITANKIAGTKDQHGAVKEFNLATGTGLNAGKSHWLTEGTQAEAEASSPRLLVPDQVPIKPRVRDPESSYPPTVRYLGAWTNLELNWRTMLSRMGSVVREGLAIMRDNGMAIKPATWLWNHMIVPRLEKGLRLGLHLRRDGEGDFFRRTVKTWQAMFNRYITSTAGAAHTDSSPSLGVMLGCGAIHLPTHAALLARNDLLLRLNGSDHDPASLSARTRVQALYELTPGEEIPWLHHKDTMSFLYNRWANNRAPLRPRPRQNYLNRYGEALLDLLGDHHVLLPNYELHLNSQLVEMMGMRHSPLGPPVGRDAHIAPSLSSAIEGFFTEPTTLNPPAEFQAEIDPYAFQWHLAHRDEPIDFERIINSVQGTLWVFTDGSTTGCMDEDSGAAAVWVGSKDGFHHRLATIRARARRFEGNYLPELLGLSLALKFTPRNCPIIIVYDCESAALSAKKLLNRVSHRSRITVSARQPLEITRRLLNARSAPTNWVKVTSHAGKSWGNDAADEEAKKARSGYQSTLSRVWRIGAERLILLRSAPPRLMRRPFPASSGRMRRGPHTQVMERVRNHFERWNLQQIIRSEAFNGSRLGLICREATQQLPPTLDRIHKITKSKVAAAAYLLLTGQIPTRTKRFPEWRGANRSPPRKLEDKECIRCLTGAEDNCTHFFQCPLNVKALRSIANELWLTLVVPRIKVHHSFPITQTDRCRLHMWAAYKGLDLTLNLNAEGDNPLSPSNLKGTLISPTLLNLMNAWIKGLGLAPARRDDTHPEHRNRGCRNWARALQEQRNTDANTPIVPVLSPENGSHIRADEGPHPLIWSSLASLRIHPSIFTLVADCSPWLAPPEGIWWYRLTRENRRTTQPTLSSLAPAINGRWRGKVALVWLLTKPLREVTQIVRQALESLERVEDRAAHRPTERLAFILSNSSWNEVTWILSHFRGVRWTHTRSHVLTTQAGPPSNETEALLPRRVEANYLFVQGKDSVQNPNAHRWQNELHEWASQIVETLSKDVDELPPTPIATLGLKNGAWWEGHITPHWDNRNGRRGTTPPRMGNEWRVNPSLEAELDCCLTDEARHRLGWKEWVVACQASWLGCLPENLRATTGYSEWLLIQEIAKPLCSQVLESLLNLILTHTRPHKRMMERT